MILKDNSKKVMKAEAAGLDNVYYLHAGLGEGKIAKGIYDRAVLVTVLGEIPDQTAALNEIYAALKPGSILLITEIIFDPHFQRHKKVLHLANEVGFKEKDFFGWQLAYTMHFEKI